MPQVRIGWRSGAVSPVVSVSKLLDSYSGAAAAYSLRKLNSSYTGSAIRVRRSSDNTELNIGFDSNGNLDTYALSAFVGTGNGFVTTWYDQSGSSKDVTQATAANQPRIVSGGIIDVLSNKPSIYFDGSNDCLDRTDTGMPTLGTTVLHISKYDSSSVGQAFVVNWGQGSSAKAFYNMYFNTGLGLSNYGESFFVGGRLNTNNLTIITKPNAAGYQTWRMYINSTNTSSGSMNSQTALLNSSGGFRIGRVNPSQANTYAMLGYISELVIWPSDLNTQRTSLEENANAYYSIYPNPTSVWNLLAAAYNADTIASSSLKTSLYAVYNGESNANDSFGTKNGTAVGGVTYSTGKIGNAFSFNGSNAYVSLPRTTNQFDFTDFSISAWFNPSLTTSGTIFSNYHYINNSNQYGYLLYLQSSKIRFAIYQGTTSPVVGFNGVNIGQSSLNITTNTWYHIVITKTASNDFKMYINGSLQSLATISGSLNANPVYNSLNRVDIGSQWGVWSLFNGKIDALNTWTKELTASEVSELYNSGNGAQYIGDNFYKPTTNDALLVNNGTAVGGLTYEVGKVGTAFQFNGTNAYVSLPNSSGQFNFTGDFSVSCWFKTNTVSGNQMIFSNLAYNGGNRKGYYIVLADNTIGCWLVNQPTYSQQFFTSAAVSINTWYHLSVTRESGVVKIYLNGTLLATDTNAITLGNYVTVLTSIGAYTNGVSTISYFNGQIDALNIWQKSLTQSEITELYNAGNGKQYPN